MTESFYELLGVRPDADDEAIREAYRERIKETHPDVSEAPDADVRTKRLVEAKETLLDPVERRRYDRLGHESYVSGGDAGESPAARAARDASTDTDDTSESGSSGDRGANGGPSNARTGPWERRARERRARERVETNVDWTDDGGQDGERGATTSTAHATGHTSTWGTSMRDRRVDPTVDPTARSRRPRGRRPWISIEESPATVTATFGLYPLLVAGAVLPVFPLYVNVIVGICTVFLIAALQSMPGVGVFVFGTWSVIGAVGLVLAGVHPISLVGLLVLGSTWFPLGLTLLTYLALRA